MTEPGPRGIVTGVAGSRDGTEARDARSGERHCAVCGQPADRSGGASERFGEAFCSESHAEEFVSAVRAATVQAAAVSSTGEMRRDGGAADGVAQRRDWKTYLGKGLCWGAPLVALVFVLGGGSTLLGAAGALVPYLAFLACPLGMYFMMRSMSKMGDREQPRDKPSRPTRRSIP